MNFLRLKQAIPFAPFLSIGGLVVWFLGNNFILSNILSESLPGKLIDRPKQGFGLPLNEWFEEGLGIDEKKIICEFVTETDFFDKNYIRNVINRKGDTRLWFILNLAIWWKIFITDNRLKFL